MSQNWKRNCLLIDKITEGERQKQQQNQQIDIFRIAFIFLKGFKMYQFFGVGFVAS